MEVLLQLIFEFFLEFVLQIGIELIAEVGFHKLAEVPWARRTINAGLAVIFYLALGLALGAFTLIIFPHSFIRGSRFHGISLIVTPTLAGLTMAGVGWLRARKGESKIRLDSFAYGFIFAFGMALMRFWFTT